MTVHLLCESSEQWIQVVMDDFDAFLIDHAANEKKASSAALTLAAHYPDKPDLVTATIDLAIEELQHYREVFQLMCQRNLINQADRKDAYVNQLRKALRPGTEMYLLDRLLVASIIEARGVERFTKVADALPSGNLKNFYKSLVRSEVRHSDLFLTFANRYYSADLVGQRFEDLLRTEATVFQSLPIQPSLH